MNGVGVHVVVVGVRDHDAIQFLCSDKIKNEQKKTKKL
jgi:hypothetical protein